MPIKSPIVSALHGVEFPPLESPDERFSIVVTAPHLILEMVSAATPAQPKIELKPNLKGKGWWKA